MRRNGKCQIRRRSLGRGRRRSRRGKTRICSQKAPRSNCLSAHPLVSSVTPPTKAGAFARSKLAGQPSGRPSSAGRSRNSAICRDLDRYQREDYCGCKNLVLCPFGDIQYDRTNGFVASVVFLLVSIPAQTRWCSPPQSGCSVCCHGQRWLRICCDEDCQRRECRSSISGHDQPCRLLDRDAGHRRCGFPCSAWPVLPRLFPRRGRR